MQTKTDILPWNLHIKAQAKHFTFNLKLRLHATTESLCKFEPHRFSLHLKLRKWRIRLESDSGSPAIKTELLKRNGSVKSKLARIFQKLRSRLRIKGRTEKSKKFSVDKSRLVKCGAFSVALIVVVVASAFGFDATKLLEFAV